MRTTGFFGPFSLGSPEPWLTMTGAFLVVRPLSQTLGGLEHFRTGGSPMALWIRNLLIFFGGGIVKRSTCLITIAAMIYSSGNWKNDHFFVRPEFLAILGSDTESDVFFWSPQFQKPSNLIWSWVGSCFSKFLQMWIIIWLILISDLDHYYHCCILLPAHDLDFQLNSREREKPTESAPVSMHGSRRWFFV